MGSTRARAALSAIASAAAVVAAAARRASAARGRRRARTAPRRRRRARRRAGSRPRRAPAPAAPARCSRTRRCSSATSAAISSLRRASVCSSNRITKNSGDSSIVSLSDCTSAAEQRVGALDAGDRLRHPLHPQVAVAPHDLDQQPLLRAEVVVQQPARDAGLARDVVERRAGRAAQPDRGAHRVDDPLRLLARELAAGARCLHAREASPLCQTGPMRLRIPALAAAALVALLLVPAAPAQAPARAGAEAHVASGDLGIVGRAAVRDGGRDSAAGAAAEPGLEIAGGRATARASRAGGRASARATATADGVSLFDGLVTADARQPHGDGAGRRRDLRRLGHRPGRERRRAGRPRRRAPLVVRWRARHRQPGRARACACG